MKTSSNPTPACLKLLLCLGPARAITDNDNYKKRSSTYLVPGERHGASAVSRHGGRGKRLEGGEHGRLLSSRLWRTSASDNSVGNRRLSSSVITPFRPAASHSRAQERTDLIDDGGGDPFTFTIVQWTPASCGCGTFETTRYDDGGGVVISQLSPSSRPYCFTAHDKNKNTTDRRKTINTTRTRLWQKIFLH